MLGMEDDTEPNPEKAVGLKYKHEKKKNLKASKKKDRMLQRNLPTSRMTNPYWNQSPAVFWNFNQNGFQNPMNFQRMQPYVAKQTNHHPVYSLQRMPWHQYGFDPTSFSAENFDAPHCAVDETHILGKALLDVVNDPGVYDSSEISSNPLVEHCTIRNCPTTTNFSDLSMFPPLTISEELFDLNAQAFNGSPICANWGTPRHYFDGCLVDGTNSNEYRQNNSYMPYKGKLDCYFPVSDVIYV